MDRANFDIVDSKPTEKFWRKVFTPTEPNTGWGLSLDFGDPVQSCRHITVADASPDDGPDPGCYCQKCGREGDTKIWAPQGPIGVVHGTYAFWCALCINTAQIEFARDIVAALPALMDEREEILKERAKVHAQ